MTNAFRGYQRLVEGRDGAIDIACTRLGFSERNLEEPIEGQMLFRQQFGGAPHVLETVAGPRRFQPSPGHREKPRTLATLADRARA